MTDEITSGRQALQELLRIAGALSYQIGSEQHLGIARRALAGINLALLSELTPAQEQLGAAIAQGIRAAVFADSGQGRAFIGKALKELVTGAYHERGAAHRVRGPSFGKPKRSKAPEPRRYWVESDQ